MWQKYRVDPDNPPIPTTRRVEVDWGAEFAEASEKLIDGAEPTSLREPQLTEQLAYMGLNWTRREQDLVFGSYIPPDLQLTLRHLRADWKEGRR